MFLKRLSISGFRGIPGPLELDFSDGSTSRSLILYGANGTGKSSITDAWEWLTTGRIEHLAREGAEERSYPNVGAEDGKSYVEAEFTEPAVGTVRLTYDNKRITKPIGMGNLAALRALIAHPCHIRYGDLTRFVFLNKAERYDALASLMGFVPQMEYQKALRRVENSFSKDVERLTQMRLAAGMRLEKHFNAEARNEDPLLQVSRIAQARNHGETATLDDAEEASRKLQSEVEQDPGAMKLAGLKILAAALDNCSAPMQLEAVLKTVRGAVGQVLAIQTGESEEQLRIPLLSAAERLLVKTGAAGVCPLCGKAFDGDLREHVQTELAALKHLRDALNHLTECRDDLSERLSKMPELASSFEKALGSGEEADADDALMAAFKATAAELDALVARLRNLQGFDSSALSEHLVEELRGEESRLPGLCADFEVTRASLLADARARSKVLETAPARVSLVRDAQFVRDGVKLMKEERDAIGALAAAEAVLKAYSDCVSQYVAACLQNVQSRFDEISDQVKEYFETLEQHTPGLGNPRLKLLPDQDRSVVLEVSFRGADVQPAYKYLSESQLNSFGLAVFLASATHFNPTCRLLILDDVVNSFDAYKRPLLIALLKRVNDRQVLLMTHDSYWRDVLYRALPTWKRLHCAGYTPGAGPNVLPGRDRLERVAAALAADEPDEAARSLAHHMEDLLQEICERFDVELKYNRRNEYTLETLLDSLRVRVQKKLGQKHPLAVALVDLHEASPFRNWVAHCKLPSAPLHKDEVQDVLDRWKGIEASVTCSAKGCWEIIAYDGKSAFCCPCGQKRVEKATAAGDDE